MSTTSLLSEKKVKSRPELGQYEDWYPASTYKKLHGYKLIIFDWNAIFSSLRDGPASILPGVRDTLYTLKNFYCASFDNGRRKDPIEMCLIRDCEAEETPNLNSYPNKKRLVRKQPTEQEWSLLKPLIYDAKENPEGIFDRKDVCFAISSKSRKPSPICLEHFMSEWIGLGSLLENDEGTANRTVWPPSQTLFVGSSWRDFTASNRANADFAWASRFFGGMTGNTYWYESQSSLMDLKKEWYQRENASPFSIEYKACVEIVWNDPSYDPSDSKNDEGVEKKVNQRSQKQAVSALMALNLLN